MNTTYAQKSSTVQKAADSNAASVLDLSSQGESLQRKADMANGGGRNVVRKFGGVVQKIGDAKEKFYYYPTLKDGVLDNRSGYITFCPYQNVECKSDNFTGCLMMAFHFLYDKNEKYDGFHDVNSIFFNPKDVPEKLKGKYYIAHVYMDSGVECIGDTRSALYDVSDRVIKIDAMFKPNKPSLLNKLYANKENFRGQGMTGGLTKYEEGWVANVYAQSPTAYKILKGKNNEDYSTTPLETIDCENLKKQTIVTLAFVCATVGDQGKEQFEKLYGSFSDEDFKDLCKITPNRGLENLKRLCPNRETFINKELKIRENQIKEQKCCIM